MQYLIEFKKKMYYTKSNTSILNYKCEKINNYLEIKICLGK